MFDVPCNFANLGFEPEGAVAPREIEERPWDESDLFRAMFAELTPLEGAPEAPRATEERRFATSAPVAAETAAGLSG